MLRFRPIAPKPSAGDHSAPPLDGINASAANTGRRSKRKYVRIRARRQSKRRTNGISAPPRRDSGTKTGSSAEKGVVTLQLLEERSEIHDRSSVVDRTQKDNNRELDEFTTAASATAASSSAAASVVRQVPVASQGFRSVVETWIVVESVTDTHIDGGVGVGLRLSDSEKMSFLQVDSCPCFISDSTDKVVWINEAFAAEGDEENGILVRLVVNERLPQFCPSFACRVKLIQHFRDGQKWNRIVPCDVWKMDSAGFAWKLDVNTALGLGI